MRAIRLIIALFVAALVVINAPAERNLTNSVSGTQNQQVSVEKPRKASTLDTDTNVGVEQEKTQTEPEAEPKPEPAAETVSVTTPAVTEPQPQGCETYRGLVEQYDWDTRVAMAVMQAESGCNPNAHSHTADRGLMQVNAVHADMVDYDLGRLFDPSTNIQVAYRVYRSQGWQGWSAYNNGAYLKFL